MNKWLNVAGKTKVTKWKNRVNQEETWKRNSNAMKTGLIISVYFLNIKKKYIKIEVWRERHTEFPNHKKLNTDQVLDLLPNDHWFESPQGHWGKHPTCKLQGLVKLVEIARKLAQIPTVIKKKSEEEETKCQILNYNWELLR